MFYVLLLLKMLKLNIYKKKCRLLESTVKKKYVVSNFLFRSVQRSCNFDVYFTEARRLGLLFIWTHHCLRKALFRSLHFKSQCLVTWRTGSVFSFFKLTRLEIRERAHLGFLSGVQKSSW